MTENFILGFLSNLPMFFVYAGYVSLIRSFQEFGTGDESNSQKFVLIVVIIIGLVFIYYLFALTETDFLTGYLCGAIPIIIYLFSTSKRKIYDKNEEIKTHECYQPPDRYENIKPNEDNEDHKKNIEKNRETIQITKTLKTILNYNFDGENILYEGEGKNGLAHGKGKATTESGSYKCEGEFKDGMMHGYGYVVMKINEKLHKFHGQLRNSNKNGYGVEIITYKNDLGDREKKREGNWINDKMNGHGVEIDRTVYEGSLDNETKREGNWVNDKMNGQGKIEFFNGNVYIGEFKDNLGHGKGTTIFQDKSEHTGEYEYGFPNGYGELKYPSNFNKKPLIGKWILGDFQKD